MFADLYRDAAWGQNQQCFVKCNLSLPSAPTHQLTNIHCLCWRSKYSSFSPTPPSPRLLSNFLQDSCCRVALLIMLEKKTNSRAVLFLHKQKGLSQSSPVDTVVHKFGSKQGRRTVLLTPHCSKYFFFSFFFHIRPGVSQTWVTTSGDLKERKGQWWVHLEPCGCCSCCLLSAHVR